jgi:uroporphyrinogen-III synthase
MPAKDGFELQDGDIDLYAVYQLRIATIDHLAALSGRSVRALWGRLLKLKTRRYLASVARFMQKQVYAIGSKGVPVLIEYGYRQKYPGIHSFVVATVTQTPERAEALRKDLHPLIPHAASRDAYLFISFEDLGLGSLLPKAAARVA